MTTVMLLLGAVLAGEGGGDHRIGAAIGPYFLCDDRVVQDRWNIERFVNPLERQEDHPLIVRDKPWEGTGPHMGGSVLIDPAEGNYKMWYSVWNSHAYYNGLPFSYNVCYAESADGIHWMKPDLGVFDYEGSTANNLIKLGEDKTQNIDVCLNPLPDRYPGRFLAIHNQKGGVFVSSSEEGNTFTKLWDTPAIAYHSDTHNNFVFDEVGGLWFLFCRPRAWAGDHRRRVAMQTSPDLHDWTHEQTILVPGETELPEFYGMTVFRSGDLFFGALQVYDRSTGIMRAELAWSGDGVHWDTLPKHPYLFDVGAAGSWDAGMVLLADAPVVVGDALRFYYGGFPLGHDTKEENVGSIGLALADRDRLIGLRPVNETPGAILTRPFIVPANATLTLNAKVRGAIRAELRTDGNKTIENWALDDFDLVTEHGFAQAATWRGKNLGEVEGEEVRLLFELDDAEVFSFDLNAG